MELKNVAKKYGHKEVLKDINLEMVQGEIIGLIGKNGAGKTTLMKIICDNISNFEGNLNNSYKLGCLIETPKLYENKTGMYNINYFSQLFGYKVDKAFLFEIATKLEIDAVLNKKVKKYSLGMKQKLALLLAIINKPDFLILDEPTNGMDVETSYNLLSFLKELVKKENMGILISSHKLEDVESICTRILLLKQGALLKDEPIEKITESLCTVVLSSIEEANRFASTYKGDIKSFYENEVVIKNINENDTSEIISVCSKQQLSLVNIKFAKNDLRNAYLKDFLEEIA